MRNKDIFFIVLELQICQLTIFSFFIRSINSYFSFISFVSKKSLHIKFILSGSEQINVTLFSQLTDRNVNNILTEW